MSFKQRGTTPASNTQRRRAWALAQLINAGHSIRLAIRETQDDDIINRGQVLIAETEWLAKELRKEWGFKPTKIEDTE